MHSFAHEEEINMMVGTVLYCDCVGSFVAS